MEKHLRLSRFLSLILRHKPEVANVKMDTNGWIEVEELIEGINKTGRVITLQILKEIVDSDSKERYSFKDKYKFIRANQGHSAKVDLQLQQKTSPNILYHDLKS